jgi:hypothetical protein
MRYFRLAFAVLKGVPLGQPAIMSRIVDLAI